MKAGSSGSLVELRAVFPTADLISDRVVFTVSGNTTRVITAIHYNRGKVYALAVLTHAEYDKGRWKE